MKKLGYENLDIIETDKGEIMLVLEDTSFKREICEVIQKSFVHTRFDHRPGFIFQTHEQAESAAHKIVTVYNEKQKTV